MIIGHQHTIPETEKEAIELLKVSLRGGIDDCTEIASQVWSGEQYSRLRRRLKTVELCCRTIATMRGDARWLVLIRDFAELQQRARRWLAPATVETKKCFAKLAALLGHMLKLLTDLETRRTGRSGLILPQPLPHFRQGRPVQIMMPG
jgi:hypothetical protein